MRARFHLQVIIIDSTGLFLQVITDGVEHQPREIDGATVTEVTAVTQVQSHERVAGFQTCHEHRHVRLRTRVRLHIHVLCIIELFQTVTRDVLRDIDYLATTVVTVTRITLRVLIGQHAAHRFHYLIADEVLTRDQLNALCLTLPLTADDVKNLIVPIHRYCGISIAQTFATAKVQQKSHICKSSRIFVEKFNKQRIN